MTERKVASYFLRKIKGIFILLTSPRPFTLIVERLREVLNLLPMVGFSPFYLADQSILSVGFEYEKRAILRGLFPENRLFFIPHWLSVKAQSRLVKCNRHSEALVWSKRDNDLNHVAEWTGKAKIRFEDGFVRSQGLGVMQALPHSFTLDRSGLYFDATTPSELEDSLAASSLTLKLEDLKRAREIMSFMLKHSVTKYGSNQEQSFVLPSDAVLVIGQVEDDASITANSNGFQTNVELLQEALANHDAAKVFYRPHPDVAIGARPSRSNPEELIEPDRVVPTEVSISSLLQMTSSIYTISSLAGFEGLMCGAKVYTFGGPFYAGWGLTHDRLQFPRRGCKLSIEQIFYCAYINYPIYFIPSTGERTSLEAVLEALTSCSVPECDGLGFCHGNPPKFNRV